MALVVKDRVKETTTTTGTGTITLGGAVSGFQTFTSILSNADTTYYAIIDYTNNDFEVGIGTFTSSGTTLARTTILESSNSGSAVNLGSGTKEVFITYPAEKSVYLDASNQLVINGSSVTSTVSELNILSGVTSTAAELNILDGKSFVDEDDMDSNSATAIASQQSIKAYVDSQVTAQDLDLITDSGTIAIDLDSETLTIGGTSNEIETSATGNAVTIGLPSATQITTSLGVGGGSTNGVQISQGAISIKNGGSQSYIDFYCESSNAHYARLQAPAHSAFGGNIILTLPATTDTLVGKTTTDTLTNKTLTSPTISGGSTTIASPAISGTATFGGTNGVSISQGAISIKNGGTQSYVDFYCESSNAHYARLQAPAHSDFSGNITLTLPASAGTVALTSDIQTTEQIQDLIGAMFSSNTETGITATYQDSDGTIDLVIADASTIAKGLAIFSPADFSVNSGAVTIKSGGVTNTQLANSSVSFGGVSLALGASDATPAFDLTDATNYPTSSLSGTITNAQLAGSIANSKLANSSVSFGGISLALGASDATPAFDLSDATNYPTSSLSGTITNAQLAGSIANSKLANSSITVSDGSNTTATALGGTITFSGTSDEVTVSESSGTITIGLPDDVTVSNNLTVTGNLTVSGTTTQTGAVTTNDNFNILSNNNTANNTDFGLAGKYVESSTTKYAGIFYDASTDNTFRLFCDTTTEPSTTVDTSASGYAAANLIIGALTTSGITIGSTAVSATAAELNLLDGGTSASSSITVVDADRFIVNDDGTMKQIAASDLKTYASADATALAIALG